MNRKFYFTPTDNYHANLRRIKEDLHTGRFLVEETSEKMFKITDMENESYITLNAISMGLHEIASVLTQATQKKVFPKSLPDYEMDEESGLALLKSE